MAKPGLFVSKQSDGTTLKVAIARSIVAREHGYQSGPGNFHLLVACPCPRKTIDIFRAVSLSTTLTPVGAYGVGCIFHGTYLVAIEAKTRNSINNHAHAMHAEVRKRDQLPIIVMDIVDVLAMSIIRNLY